MSDLLFRGRGADVGARAPTIIVRGAGALLGLCTVQFFATLGVVDTLGMPLSLARALAMTIGALVATSSVGSWLWGSTTTGALLLLTVSYTPLIPPLLDAFVRRDPESGPPVDAVVVFSGSVTSEGRVMGPALDRLLTGIAEGKRRRIPALVLSTVGDDDDPTVATSERDQRELAAAFAPELALRFVHDVHSTRDEALAFAALARTNGWRRVLVVTSPAHTRRACKSVERVGLAVQCLPAVSRSYALSRLDRPDSRRQVFADLLYESAATLLYRSRGWQ
ncbi:YdcF family protein [Gemmatimonas sp.]|uniref:YdcF family protein n=1 Tax=Gemmatimonas sp. TaxID=1962908 RepID=UPI003F6F5729